MPYSVDVNLEYQKAKSKYLRWSLLFALLLTLTLVADTLLIILSGDNYLVYLIIACVITVLFSWFAVFFFSSLYGDINGQYLYFKGYESGIKPVEEVMFLKRTNELTKVNNLYVYPVYVRFFDGIQQQEKIIYTLDETLNYERGDKLTITIYQRILIKAEKHS